MRTCVGCGRRAPKAAMVRLVRTAEGSVSVDPAARAPGRGAYVHRDERCVDAAGKRFGGALRVMSIDFPSVRLAVLATASSPSETE